MDHQQSSIIDTLTQENIQLKENISSLQALLGSQICTFFEICNSINQTKIRFCYETVSECYHDLIYFYGCSEPLQDADDFKDCYKKVFNREFSDEDNNTDDENNKENEALHI